LIAESVNGRLPRVVGISTSDDAAAAAIADIIKAAPTALLRVIV
jgi:hypothetical protein